MPKYLYTFLDEAGNFDWSPNGTSYFTITAISLVRPFNFYPSLASLKYDLIEEGMGLEYFHACEDTQNVRNRVFEVIVRDAPNVVVDSIIVEKRKTNPVLRETKKFYAKMLGYLMRYVCDSRNIMAYDGVVVVTDRIPINKARKATEKAIKMTMSTVMEPFNRRYRVLHHDSKSSFSLQVVDYLNWAIFRKWTKNDPRSYDLIKHRIRSEFDIFARGTTYYY